MSKVNHSHIYKKTGGAIAPLAHPVPMALINDIKVHQNILNSTKSPENIPMCNAKNKTKTTY